MSPRISPASKEDFCIPISTHIDYKPYPQYILSFLATFSTILFSKSNLTKKPATYQKTIWFPP
jgi:hypothetical protein